MAFSSIASRWIGYQISTRQNLPHSSLSFPRQMLLNIHLVKQWCICVLLLLPFSYTRNVWWWKLYIVLVSRYGIWLVVFLFAVFQKHCWRCILVFYGVWRVLLKEKKISCCLQFLLFSWITVYWKIGNAKQEFIMRHEYTSFKTWSCKKWIKMLPSIFVLK